jgi:adenylate cyclase
MNAVLRAHRQDRAGEVRRRADRLQQAFAAEERAGLALAVKGRTVALLAVAVLLAVLAPFPGVLYYHLLLALFIGIGLADLALQRSAVGRPWHRYALATLDSVLLAFTLLYPNPFRAVELAPQALLQVGNFIYFFVPLAGLALSYRPGLVVWGGISGAASWAAGVAWLLSLPDTVATMPDAGDPRHLEIMRLPTFINLGARLQEIVVLLVVAGLLGVVAHRSRRIAWRQASLERERSNLARYFPPATVDLLSDRDDPLSEVREHQAAVLFADIVGFTPWAEQHSPRESIMLLREVHALFEECVFANGGTLDKFIGDGMMATFGTPDPGTRDAANGVACVGAILAAIDAWNGGRSRAGEAPVTVSLGLHYGPVVVGDIGSERRLELAVLGDTVNVASRLEGLTRQLGCRAVLSGDVIAAAARQSPAAERDAIAAAFAARGPTSLKGRREPVNVWAR